MNACIVQSRQTGRERESEGGLGQSVRRRSEKTNKKQNRNLVQCCTLMTLHGDFHCLHKPCGCRQRGVTDERIYFLNVFLLKRLFPCSNCQTTGRAGPHLGGAGTCLWTSAGRTIMRLIVYRVVGCFNWKKEVINVYTFSFNISAF